ncbi:hypothetical protein CSIM01_00891 [Colletotrichum simmondsii]|uniref:Homeobox and C2H2 transcription factor n=1 Tax=Colletotrichum simmondsii TaxID=703756 RepID=A0A135S342_9PEZI|nr:hypothetical protein CSIM01_00891 [Colletotrichum simmondsii]
MEEYVDPRDLTSFSLPAGNDEGLIGGIGLQPVSDESKIYPSPQTKQSSTGSGVSPPDRTDTAGTQTKPDGRFSHAAVKHLRAWYDIHSDHPYPSTEDVHHIGNHTGLSRQQIRDWFANSRRRAKIRPSTNAGRSSTDVNTALPRNIPQRRPTPTPHQHLNPFQRWEHSPPSDEAASLSDIYNAIALSGGPTDHSTNPEVSFDHVRTPSSVVTSQSSAGSGSCSSAHSQGSQNSFGSRERTRKTAAQRRRPARYLSSKEQSHTYQCTFCPKSFKSKYDWQRHEKSVHLPFEQWVCTPQGPRTDHPRKGFTCSYCGETDPDRAHLTGHNDEACFGRPLDERTFYRKDHLIQHLHTVHKVSHNEQLMRSWMVVRQDIRSRCGFCDAWLESWAERTDHLARHFRHNKTMADWNGDWGFDPAITDLLENTMPPYLIPYEKRTAMPFPEAGRLAGARPNAHQLVKEEIALYIQNHFDKEGDFPCDQDLCRLGKSVIQTAERIWGTSPSAPSSWLRDILIPANLVELDGEVDIGNPHHIQSPLSLDSGEGIFENCPLEDQLRRFVRMHHTLGRECPDHDIQSEACRILNQIEGTSLFTSRHVLGFLTRLVWESAEWIYPLRRRAKKDLLDIHPEEISNGQDVVRLGAGLTEMGAQWFTPQGSSLSAGSSSPAPAGTSMELAECRNWRPQIVGDHDFTNSPASHPQSILSSAPKPPNVTDFQPDCSHACGVDVDIPSWNSLRMPSNHFIHSGFTLIGRNTLVRASSAKDSYSDSAYQRLVRELALYVIKTTSPNNPERHVPTDNNLLKYSPLERVKIRPSVYNY